MVTRCIKIIFFAFASLLSSVSVCFAQEDVNERHIKVSMRMIGHEILLSSGDSSSRVLPIEKEADRYSVQFEAELQFNSDDLVTIIDRVVKKANIANSYLVEVENCETNKVIYGYEIGNEGRNDVIPCRTRAQPKACYRIYFTILDANNSITSLLTVSSGSLNVTSSETKQVNYFTIALLIIPLLLLIGFFISIWKKRRKPYIDPNIIFMGEYQFNKRNMELSFQNEIIELSSKESDLLLLLHTSVNITLEREIILKTVWGDEGGYIGRTLDVFISKLRKKLEDDSSVKIVNIRGIGYKLVLNG